MMHYNETKAPVYVNEQVPVNKLIRMAYIDSRANPGIFQEVANAIDWNDEETYQGGGFSEEFIKEFADKINWTYLTMYQKFSIDELCKYANRIDWKAASEYQELTEPIISSHRYEVDWDLISIHQSLNCAFIDMMNEYVNWNNISRYQVLNSDTMLKYYEKINWTIASMYQKDIPVSFIREYPNYIEWGSYSLQLGPDDMLIVEEFTDKIVWSNICFELGIEFVVLHDMYVDWDRVSQYEKFTEQFMIAYEDEINWEIASWHQTLNEDIIREHEDRVDWSGISYEQVLSESFIDEYKDSVDWENIALSQNLSREFIEAHTEYLYKYMNHIIKRGILSDEFIDDHRLPVQIEKIDVEVQPGENANEYVVNITNGTRYVDYPCMYNISSDVNNAVFGQNINHKWEHIATGDTITLEPGKVLNVYLVNTKLNIVVGAGSYAVPLTT